MWSGKEAHRRASGIWYLFHAPYTACRCRHHILIGATSTLPRPCAGTSAQAPEKEKLLYIQRESHCSLATPLAFGGYFLVKVNVSGRNYAPPTPALSPLLLGKQAQPGFISDTSGRESFLMCYREIPALSLLAAFVLLIRSLCPNFVSCSSCTATSNTFES